MARVTKDNVENRFTAKDLIGAAVYDPAGERIGDITDIDLHAAVPGSLSMAFSQNKAGSSSNVGAASGSGTYTPSNTATRPSGSATTGSTSASDSTYAQSGSTAGQSATTSGARTSGSSMGAAASDALSDSSRAMSSMASSLSGATVFISVGGLWGIGDDLVSAPVSMLSYNSADERFELASTKAQVVALTEDKDDNAGYASTTGSRTGTAVGSSTTGSATAAGKQSFGDEASRVQAALRADPQVSSFAQKVQVSSDGDTIELRGSVDTEQHKKQILDVARRATTLKIEDEIDVSK